MPKKPTSELLTERQLMEFLQIVTQSGMEKFLNKEALQDEMLALFMSKGERLLRKALRQIEDEEREDVRSQT